MNQRKRSKTLRGTILDRLMKDSSPEAQTWEASVAAFKANLLRDLEWLLNTRESGDPATAPYSELERSIYNYGLPDFASMSADSLATRARLQRSIERKIAVFEPRLKDVRVTVLDEGKGGLRAMRFEIEAMLRLDPDPERVEFDMELEMTDGRFSIKG